MELIWIIVAGLVFWFFADMPSFFCWLKGSRMSYYVADSKGLIVTTKRKLRTYTEQGYYYRKANTSIIEISRGPFRRRSAFYGSSGSWQIEGDRVVTSSIAVQGDWVSVTDSKGLPVEKALQMVNTYSSLWVMLDRIAELESDLGEARERLCLWHSGAQALLGIIQKDKQRYRSPASQKIRHCLEILKTEMIEWPGKWKKPAPGFDSHEVYDYTIKFEELT